MENRKSLMTYNAGQTEESNEHIKLLRQVFQLAEDAVNERCPNSRRKSLALTHLETALMFAVKSVAMGE